MAGSMNIPLLWAMVAGLFLNGCVNTRDGNQVAAMSGPTLDRVFDRGWLRAWSQNCVVVSFPNSLLMLFMI